MKPEDLPDLHQAWLDEATLDDLFRDIELLTEVVAVTRKDGSQAMASEETLTLARARELLSAGEVRGIQIRYRHQGGEWWDTLLRTPRGVKLVRIRHPLRARAARPGG